MFDEPEMANGLPGASHEAEWEPAPAGMLTDRTTPTASAVTEPLAEVIMKSTVALGLPSRRWLLYVVESQVRLNPGQEHTGPTPKGYEMSIAPQFVGHGRPAAATAVAARSGTTSGRTAMVILCCIVQDGHF
jgi:hypothetical protein